MRRDLTDVCFGQHCELPDLNEKRFDWWAFFANSLTFMRSDLTDVCFWTTLWAIWPLLEEIWLMNVFGQACMLFNLYEKRFEWWVVLAKPVCYLTLMRRDLTDGYFWPTLSAIQPFRDKIWLMGGFGQPCVLSDLNEKRFDGCVVLANHVSYLTFMRRDLMDVWFWPTLCAIWPLLEEIWLMCGFGQPCVLSDLY